MADIVRSNLWLIGSLKTNPSSGKVALWIPTEGAKDYRNCLEIKHIVKETDSDDIDFHEFQLPEFWVKPGFAIVDAEEHIFKIVALVETSKQRWHLLMSMSHVVADAHTFYMIHNIVDKAAAICPMEVKRTHFSPIFCLPGVPFHWKWFFWFFNQTRIALLCQKKQVLNIRMRYVNMDWVEEQKKNFAAEPDAPFISANDLLTSWFFRETKPACGVMMLNMRGRMKGLEDEHAGVYSTMLIFYPNEYKSPANIRRAIQRKSPACTLEGRQQWPGRGGKCGLVTSFHTFNRDLQFDGCTQQLHVPSGASGDKEALQGPSAIIFRPSSDQLAMVTITEEELSSGPLGADVLRIAKD